MKVLKKSVESKPEKVAPLYTSVVFNTVKIRSSPCPLQSQERCSRANKEQQGRMKLTNSFCIKVWRCKGENYMDKKQQWPGRFTSDIRKYFLPRGSSVAFQLCVSGLEEC